MLFGCSDASPTANGGQPLLGGGMSTMMDDAGSTSGPPTWGNLYATVFSADAPAGAGCGQSGCHAAGGSGSSFWACGDPGSSSSCYAGIVPMIVPMGGATDPTTTPLYKALSQSSCTPGITACNMPLGLPPLSQARIDTIKMWIQAGAPDN